MLFISYLGFEYYKASKKQFAHFKILFSKVIFIHLGIIISAAIFNSPQSFFWAPDSVGTHIPESIKYMNAFRGDYVEDLGKLPGKTTHIVTAIVMSVFGVHTWTTLLSQLLFKSLSLYCTYYIGKTLWNREVGIAAMLILGLTPTVFFYNITFYKESAVQAFIALTIACYLKIFIEKKYLYIILSVIALGVLSKERLYIFYLFLPLPIFFIFIRFFKENVKNYIFLFILFAGFLAFINKFFGSIYYGFFETAWIQIQNARIANSGYADVNNAFNYEIPYFVAFLKIIFTPYFTFNKFDIFSNTSLLLVWGSPINQIVMLLSMYGGIKAVIQNRIHLIIWIPLLIFFTLAAYISPWSGRLRDSFYPIVSIYSAFAIYTILNNQKIKDLIYKIIRHFPRLNQD